MDVPGWLAAAHRRRGGGELVLVRRGQADVWQGQKLVGKVAASSSVVGEVEAARRADAAGVPVADCVGVDVCDGAEVAVSWWRRLDGGWCDAPLATVRLLRRCHDRADVSGVSRARGAQFDADAHLPRGVPATGWGRWSAAGAEVLVHGDPNPTNVMDTAGGVVLIDWGSAGAGPRVLDVAYVAVMAVETGSATPQQVVAAYGGHPQVSWPAVRAAAGAVAVRRWEWAARTPGWEVEAGQRLAALRAGRWFRFAPGDGPK